MKLAAVAVTYNRPRSLERLLTSLVKAHYGNHRMDLVISIDKSEGADPSNTAEMLAWPHGAKRIVRHSRHLGLRNHILECGQLLDEYDAIAVFEDDTYASPAYAAFFREASQFYERYDDVAGISLYSHQWSELNSRPFAPAIGNHDVYFMQYAQSWGQVWLRRQWCVFKEWYDHHKSDSFNGPAIPPNVCRWPESSWLKYHIKYCIEECKYFVYPYESFTTNFTDVGFHNEHSSNTYQVPLVHGLPGSFHLAPFCRDRSAVIYDAHFERELIGADLGVLDEELCVDLYGQKRMSTGRRFLLTMEPLQFRVVKSFGLRMRPHEVNVLVEMPGTSIFLYDTSEHGPRPRARDVAVEKWLFDTKHTDYPLMARLVARRILGKCTPGGMWRSTKYHLGLPGQNMKE